MRTAELLAPVGKIENAYAAIENGADALFIGGKLFNARQYADNFTDEALKEITNYARLRGVKVYITVNTLIKENETQALFNYLQQLNQIGIDAVISQDLAVAAIVNRYFPLLKLHASTQMTAHSLEDVLFLKNLGFKRVVLARELQIDEIKYITAKTDMEIETFIHGALCYSYSGQCLMSSLIGGRSGNRGRCAQPCRMKYTLKKGQDALQQNDYLLSLKDICSLPFLPKLTECGIYSFKIEGRMKSPEYVASAVRIYRKYLDLIRNDQPYKVQEEDIEVLKSIFNRGGFSKGYYFGETGKQMITPISPRHIGIRVGTVTQFSPKMNRASILLCGRLQPGDGIEIIRNGKESVGAGISKVYQKGETIDIDFDKYVAPGSEVYLTKNHELLKYLKSTYQKPLRKIPINLKVTAKIGTPICIEASYQATHIRFEGAVLELAESVPLTQDKAIKQLTKLGNTPFEIKHFELDWDERGYIAIGKLNEMRRAALSQLEEKILERSSEFPKYYTPPQMEKSSNQLSWSSLVKSIEQLKACLKRDELTAIYWEWQYDSIESREAYKLCQMARKKFYLALPYIMKSVAYQKFKEAILEWEKTDISGYLFRNYGQFHLLKQSTKDKHIDYTLNIMNNESIALWHQLGASHLTVSMELSPQETQSLKGDLEKIVYGYLPVMTSAQCILGHHHACRKRHKDFKTYQIVDRKNAAWKIQTDCEACTMQVLSERPIGIKRLEEFKGEAIKKLRMNFTIETEEETNKILEAYLSENISQIKAIDTISFKPIE